VSASVSPDGPDGPVDLLDTAPATAPATSPATDIGDDWRPLATIGAAGTAVVAGVGALIARRRRLMHRGGHTR